MKREDCRVGMIVTFGRKNGEKTAAKVVKVNPVKAQCETIGSRGFGRGSVIGTIWTVPYSMMESAEAPNSIRPFSCSHVRGERQITVTTPKGEQVVVKLQYVLPENAICLDAAIALDGEIIPAIVAALNK